MKKCFALLLAAILALSAANFALAETPVEVTVMFHGSSVSDDTAVLEKLNPYLAEKIGVTVKPIWGTWGDFDEKVMNAINTGDRAVDMMFTCSWTPNAYNVYAAKGAYVRLDDPADNLLEQYGQELTQTLPELLQQAAVTDGPDGEGIYAVNGFKDFATTNAWDINVTLLEKYGYTLEDVQNAGFFGWGDIFAKVKAGEEAERGGTFYPFVMEGMVVERYVTNSTIVTGDANLLLSYYMNPEDVSLPGAYGNVILNKYATPEYKAFVEKMHEYYQAGYVNPSLAIGDQAADTWRNAQNTANYLISSEVYSYGYEFTTSAARGIEVAYLPAISPYIDDTSATGAMIAISANSEHPEACMKFLNLLNTDPYVMTLLNYGVEGVHYELNEIGEVVFTEARSQYSPWTNGMGNVTLLPPQKGQGADFVQKFKEYYSACPTLPIYGFTFNPEPVKNEVAAVANVKEAYALTLCIGAADPAAVLPKFLQKLDDAGMQKIVDEANAQLQAFLEGK